MTWDIVVILFVVYNAITIPFEAAFGSTSFVVQIYFDYIVDVCFALDIVWTFITSYENPKTGITETKCL